MAFKLLVEITDDGALEINHEGQIDPIVLLGSLEMLKHNLLITVDAANTQAALEALGAPEGENGPEGQGE